MSHSTKVRSVGGIVSWKCLCAAAIFTYAASLYPVSRVIWISSRKNDVDIHCSINERDDEFRQKGILGLHSTKQDEYDKMIFVEPKLTLAPGELPGYTGWARPERTIAGNFQVQAVSDTYAVAGEEWYVDVMCSLEECKNGGAKFYLRAYGPAVLTGIVNDQKDGSYQMSFFPEDPGRYTVEVVLDFSHAPSFESFPFPKNRPEPGYEGFLLPGFPLQISVVSSPGEENKVSKATTDKLCTTEQLTETGSESALFVGRWKLKDSVRYKTHKKVTKTDGVSHLGYQHSVNSIGTKFVYTYNNCSMISYSRVQRYGREGTHVLDKCLADVGIANSMLPSDQIHLIFVGDSMMRLEWETFEILNKKAKARNIKTTLVDMKRGLFRKMENATLTLDQIKDENPQERRYVVFNSGLHDIDRLCSSEMEYARGKDQEIMNITWKTNSCIDVYRDFLTTFVEYMANYPAELMIFRSTTAGWLKYGNFGFAWPTTKVQPFSRSSHFSSQMNEIAYDVIQNSGMGKILITDAYWLSLPRPDHTEAGEKNLIGRHLVHMGVEVTDTMTRKFLMLMLWKLCHQTLDDFDPSLPKGLLRNPFERKAI